MKVAKKGKTNQNNYTFHEIKQIRGKKKPIPENFEIIEDLTEIHEIKETSNYNNYGYNQNYGYQRNIQGYSYNNTYQGDPNIIRCENCQREMNINDNCECPHDRNNVSNNDDQTQLKYGYVNAPFLCDDNLDNNDNDGELIVKKEEEQIYNLIDKIFEKLNNDNILNDNNLKKTFRELKENDKNEIIEGIKIKIENNEQENRFNNFLNSL